MTNPSASEPPLIPENWGENEEALAELAWAIEASVGEFKLLLARCNYASLRERMVKRLQELVSVEIRILVLKESDHTLYTTIQTQLGTQMPAAVMVLGLELVGNLEAVLTSINVVREEFRKNFHFPLVLWVNDQIFSKMVRLAPDFESWATTTEFAVATDKLIDSLKQVTDSVFADTLKSDSAEAILDLYRKIASVNSQEIEVALHELQRRGQEVEPALKASLEFVQGQNAYLRNEIEVAIAHYQQSLNFWQQENPYLRAGLADNLEERQITSPQNPPSSIQKLKLAVVLFYLGLRNLQQAENYYQSEKLLYLENARRYFQQCLGILETANRQDLVAKFINPLGEVLLQLGVENELQSLAQKSLKLQQIYHNPLRLAQAYGFLAEVALIAERWREAKQNAQQALGAIAKVTTQQHESPYLLLLAESERHLGQQQAAIAHLKSAREIGIQDSPRLYIRILQALGKLNFEQKNYLEAYLVKKERQSIEQQYGLRAFIGAGRLQPQRQAVRSPLISSAQESLPLEITASGRQLDVERLIERIGRNDRKLTVIHGYSGVGKSSLVSAGLVPALKRFAIGTQDNLPVLMRAYTNWVEELGQLLGIETQNFASGLGIAAILEKLRQNESRHLRTVLIFDQFEEFFFVYTNPVQRQQFFEFLGKCLNILSVKVILSLREDYLHYLLECSDLPTMVIIGNDILSKNILYKLGNFSVADTHSIIQQLTKNSQFHLEPALIDKLVQDLAGELGEVRPIELQVVGAQLQTENITTLADYQQLGSQAKEELVKHYIAGVVADCGNETENEYLANFVLYLLTDEKETRPLKTRAELERDLQALEADVSAQASKLDLVLNIFVESGLVFLLPENPAARYQLVHDYLAALIRQQPEPKLKKLIAELETERKQRKLSDEKLNRFLRGALAGAVAAGFGLAVLAVAAVNSAWLAKKNEIEAVSNSSEALFDSDQAFDALIESLKAQEKLKQVTWAPRETQMRVIGVLRQAIYSVRERNNIEGHSSYVTSVSFSPDGKTIAFASVDKTVKLWNLEGKELKTFQGHHSYVTSVSFSPDGKTIASASWDKTVKLWNLEGKELTTFQGHRSPVNSVSFSPDGKTIASASDDNTVKLWNLEGKELTTFQGHRSPVNSVSFSPDGKTIASASADKTVKLWNLEGKELTTFQGHRSRVNSVSFSPDGKTIASASWDNTVKLWNLEGQELKTFQGHRSYFNSVSFSPDGKTIASASDDKTVKLWNLEGKELTTFQGHRSRVNSVSFSPDGKTIASASWDNTVKLWNLEGQELKTFQGHRSGVNSVSFSPDGKTIASASDDKTVKLWNLEGKELTTFQGHRSGVNSVSFSPDGKTIASASADNTVKLWNLDGKELKTFQGHSSPVTSVSFSPDGKTIASASEDKTVKLWNLEGKELTTFQGHRSRVWGVSFSPDGKTIASASADKTVKLWNLEGKELTTFQGHRSAVTSVSFSPDGKTIASASWDKTVKLWNLEGKELTTFQGHSSAVTSVSFSPDGKTIVSASDDNTVKLWNLEGKQLTTFQGHRSRVNSVSFSPDGKTIASASRDNTVILWNFNLDDLLARSCKWLNNYLAIHPDVLEELQQCQTPSLLIKAALSVVTQGEEQAREGNTKGAVATFWKALKWNPKLNLDPDVKAKQLADASTLVEEGETLAQDGNIEEAVATFQKALQLDPSLDFNPRIKARQLAASALVTKGEDLVQDGNIEEAVATFQKALQLDPGLYFEPKIKAASVLVTTGESLVEQGKVKEAIAAYAQAQKLAPKVEISAYSWNSLCRYGSLRGHAADVMFACEKAVALAPDDENILDRRGLARALTGNTKGAIEDFQAYITSTNEQEIKSQRQRWIYALRAGKNPFTPEEIQRLF